MSRQSWGVRSTVERGPDGARAYLQRDVLERNLLVLWGTPWTPACAESWTGHGCTKLILTERPSDDISFVAGLRGMDRTTVLDEA